MRSFFYQNVTRSRIPQEGNVGFSSLCDQGSICDSIKTLFVEPIMNKVTGFLVLGVCVGCLSFGCSGGGDFKVGRVKGQVTCQGQPVAGALIQLIPQATGDSGMSGKSAIGTADDNGNFELSTYQPGDGAVIGTHSVKVGSPDPEKGLPGAVPDGLTFEVKPGTNELKIELVPGAGSPK